MIDEANHLLDRIENLMNDALGIASSEAYGEKAKQLKATRGLVADLERKGVSIPDEISSCEVNLAKEIQQYEIANNVLSCMRQRLAVLSQQANQGNGLAGTESEQAWRAIVQEMAQAELPFEPMFSNRFDLRYYVIRFGHRNIHYEWVLRRRTRELEIAIHLESSRPEENQRRLERLLANEQAISAATSLPFRHGCWNGGRWTQAMYLMPFDVMTANPKDIADAVRYMRIFIEHTWPTVSSFLVEPTGG